MIDSLCRLTLLLRDFAGVRRTVRLARGEDYENDVEHSYQVALVAWYVAEKHGTGINKGKILEYALVHDLVEVYAGDTDPHLSSEEYKASKSARERSALKRIEAEFPDFTSLHEAIRSYQEHADRESRLVYVVDKILPAINTYLSEDSYYVDNKVTFEAWRSWLIEKTDRVNVASLLGPEFLAELVSFFAARVHLFAKVGGE